MNKADLEVIKARLDTVPQSLKYEETVDGEYVAEALVYDDDRPDNDCKNKIWLEEPSNEETDLLKFLTRAPADIAALIAEVERLRSIIETAVKLYEGDETTKYETYNELYEVLLNAGIVKRGRI